MENKKIRKRHKVVKNANGEVVKPVFTAKPKNEIGPAEFIKELGVGPFAKKIDILFLSPECTNFNR